MAKSYSPPRVSGEFKKGENGEAQVRGDRKTVKLRFVETKRVFSCRRTKETAKLKPGRYYVQLNGDEDDVYNFHPWSGQYKVRVSGFASKEGESPTPKTNERVNKKGSSYTTVDFTALIEIVEPKKYAGVNVPYFMRYNFRETEDEEGKSVVGLPDSGSQTKKLSDFLDVTHAWDRGAMKWKDNVLPAFEKRILREDREFMIIIKDGWIDTLYEVDDIVDESNDWDDEPEDEKPVEEPVKETSDDEDPEIEWEPEDE